jgi:hypothetical protein
MLGRNVARRRGHGHGGVEIGKEWVLRGSTALVSLQDLRRTRSLES